MNLSGHAEAVNNPGRVREMLKQLDPKLVALKRPCLLFFLKVYQPFTPGYVGEATPFRRNDRRVITVFSRTDKIRVFIEREGQLRLFRYPCAFQDDFRTNVVSPMPERLIAF